jgi:hypothetical protein
LLPTRVPSCSTGGPGYDYLVASPGIDVRLWAIGGAATTIGYICGGFVRKGPFLLLGSPLKGWGTNYMGPIIDRDADPLRLRRALDDLAQREGLAMTELEGRPLSNAVMQASGFEAVRSAAGPMKSRPCRTIQTGCVLAAIERMRGDRTHGQIVPRTAIDAKEEQAILPSTGGGGFRLICVVSAFG